MCQSEAGSTAYVCNLNEEQPPPNQHAASCKESTAMQRGRPESAIKPAEWIGLGCRRASTGSYLQTPSSQ
jgi:hypothetical protein